MPRRTKPKTINPGCSLSNHDVPMSKLVFIPLCRGRVLYPACRACIKAFERDGISVLKYIDQEVRDYMAKELAFAFVDKEAHDRQPNSEEPNTNGMDGEAERLRPDAVIGEGPAGPDPNEVRSESSFAG